MAGVPTSPATTTPRLAVAFAGYVTALVVSTFAAATAALAAVDAELVALLAGQVAFWVVLVATVLYEAPGRGTPIADRLGLRFRWVDVPAGLIVGVATQLVLIPALYLPFRGVIDDDDLSGPARDLLDGVEGAGLIAMALSVIIVAPVVEELFFRGLLLQAMERRWGATTAIAGSSVFFGATHFQPLQLPGLALAGAVFATAAVRTRRLGPAVTVHAAFNATTFVALVLLA